MAGFALWIAACILLGITAISVVRSKRRRKTRALIKSRWGTPRASYDDTDLEKTIRYHNLLVASGPNTVLSDQTWDDLALDEVFQRIDHTQCPAGQQVLYHLLRTPEYSAGPLQARERLVDRFGKDVLLRESVQLHLHDLDRRETYYLPNLFQKELPDPSPSFWIAPLLTLLAVGSLVGMVF